MKIVGAETFSSSNWTGRCLGVALTLSLMGCLPPSPTDKPPVVELDLPDWQACSADFKAREIEPVDAAAEGDTAAIRCLLALYEGTERESLTALRHYYWIYRFDGIEPAGLDEIVRGMDRRRLAIKLQNYHRLSALEPFPWSQNDFDGACVVYDPLAVELLRRAQPPQDRSCLPWGLRC